MPLAARVGDAIVTGHGCDAATIIAGPGAPTVLINGIADCVMLYTNFLN